MTSDDFTWLCPECYARNAGKLPTAFGPMPTASERRERIATAALQGILVGRPVVCVEAAMQLAPTIATVARIFADAQIAALDEVKP